MSEFNKPKFKFFKNWGYAVDGLVDLIKNETSFKLQVVAFILFSIIIVFLPVSLVVKSILFLSLLFPILAEIVNSAIERVVDLVTTDYHIMAKRAKDVGATLVFISILFTVIVWSLTLYISLT